MMTILVIIIMITIIRIIIIKRYSLTKPIDKARSI